MDTVIVSGNLGRTFAAGMPNSSMALVTLAPVALVAVPLYWDNFSMLDILSHSINTLVEATVTLAFQNPAETLLSAIVTAWAMSCATRVARSPLRSLRNRAKGIYKLASNVIKRQVARRPAASHCSLLLSRLTDSVGKSPDHSPQDRARSKTGLSVKLAPGPRIVLEWVTEEAAPNTPTSSPSLSKRKGPPSISEPSLPAKAPLIAHALPDDDVAGVETLTRQSYSFDWGMFNMSSYIYWPELGWNSGQGGALPAKAWSDEVETFQEFNKTLESDLKRQSPGSLCHSQSLPAISTVRARQCISFDCAMDVAEEGDEDENVELCSPAADTQTSPFEGGGILHALSSSAVHLGADDDLRQTVPDSFMIQFAAILGEQQAVDRLQMTGLPEACSTSESIFGKPDEVHVWDKVVEESLPGQLSYRAFKRPLRRGINMYMTTTIMEDASPRELQRFLLDDTNRLKWDDSCLEHTPLKHVGASLLPSHRHDSCFLYSRTKFPRPMAAREYIYGRRVVESSYGCYIVQAVPKGNVNLSLPESHGRGVRISDYTSCSRIRAVPSPSGRPESAVELSLVYFEDSQVRPGLVNMAVTKGLLPFVKRQDAFFRCYQATLRRRSMDLQHHSHHHHRSMTRTSTEGSIDRHGMDNAFHSAQPRVPHCQPSRQSSCSDLSEVEFSTVSPQPGSRGARWKRRLFVAAVLGGQVMNWFMDRE